MTPNPASISTLLLLLLPLCLTRQLENRPKCKKKAKPPQKRWFCFLFAFRCLLALLHSQETPTKDRSSPEPPLIGLLHDLEFPMKHGTWPERETRENGQSVFPCFAFALHADRKDIAWCFSCLHILPPPLHVRKSETRIFDARTCTSQPPNIKNPSIWV